MRSAFDDILHEATIGRIRQALADGALSCVDVVDWHLARIRAHDQRGLTLNAIIALDPTAQAAAAALDRRLQAGGPIGPLHGIPVVVKDNIDVDGLPTTGGCAALRGLVPAGNATVVDRLRGAGAVILGKSNMSEFAWGVIDTLGSALPGFTRNPYDTAYASGGSSGGTGVAVSANFAVAGLGTDTGCSVRAPAAINAIVGLRPTHGRVSCRGVMPMNADWDTVGPMARTVDDVAVLLDVVAGHDPGDPLTEPARDRPSAFAPDDGGGASPSGLRIGVLRALMAGDDTHPEVLAALDAALDTLRGGGATVVDPLPIATLPPFRADMWYRRFKFDLNRYLAALGDRAPHGSLTEILASGQVHPFYLPTLRDMDAVSTPPEDAPDREEKYANRREIQRIVLTALEQQAVDAIVFPTFRYPPKRNGDHLTPVGNNNSLAAICGFPALSVPMGFTRGGLPLGLQFLGPPWSERRLLQAGRLYERLSNHRRPPAV